jgi:hypothetical protein
MKSKNASKTAEVSTDDFFMSDPVSTTPKTILKRPRGASPDSDQSPTPKSNPKERRLEEFDELNKHDLIKLLHESFEVNNELKKENYKLVEIIEVLQLRLKKIEQKLDIQDEETPKPTERKFNETIQTKKQVKTKKNEHSISFNSSYAAIAKKSQSNILENSGRDAQNHQGMHIRMPKGNSILKMVRNTEKIVPVEFKKIYLHLNPIPSLKFASRKSRVQLAYNLLNKLNIKNKVRDFSYIGKSVLELYIAEPVYEEVKKILEEQNVNIIEKYDSSKGQPTGRPIQEVEDNIINRLAFIYARNHLKKMKEAILQGFNKRITDKVIEKADGIMKQYENQSKESEDNGEMSEDE